MVSEDLFVSVERVRVRYVFRNRSSQPVRTVVAFPIADRDLADEYEMDVASVGEFRTLVDGQPVQMKVERKAFARGVDQTALLQRLGVPIDSAGKAGERLAKLPRPEQDQLRRLGLISAKPSFEAEIVPAWTLKETWYWEQVFPAGRDVKVEHSYRPGAGSGFFSGYVTDRAARNGVEARQTIAFYCMDKDFIAGIDRLIHAGGEGTELPDYWIDYVLTTGGNWRSPIGDFRLVVDKGKPENLVTFCEAPVKKIGPTQFEVRHRNWRPRRDLHVLIVESDN
jgi:hypothetical protein